MHSNNTSTILHTPKVKYQTFVAWSFQVFHTNIVESAAKVHQRLTEPRHLQEEIEDTSIPAGLQPKLTLLLKLNQ